ncbi:ArsR family transcriptional regulator [Streptomyces sp. NPDC059785]|uniref:ArsR family transcriptional regulator n=1 Tax=unclassified Streptomyces TaxID=2593676 RepID=UPI00365699DF
MLKLPVGRTRLDILEWMRNPAQDAPASGGGALVAEGVSPPSVAAALGISLPVATAHLELLARLGLLRTEGSGDRTRYRRDEYRIAEVAHLFEKGW